MEAEGVADIGVAVGFEIGPVRRGQRALQPPGEIGLGERSAERLEGLDDVEGEALQVVARLGRGEGDEAAERIDGKPREPDRRTSGDIVAGEGAQRPSLRPSASSKGAFSVAWKP